MQSKQSSFSNPYWSLLKTAWKYAHGERRRYLAVYSMFMVSNLIDALRPVIWGLFINDLQRQGAGIIRSAWLYAGAYLSLKFLGWVFHGPARIMERELSFNLSRNFLQELYHKALHLPVKWHQDNHSGVTINRIRKAYEALKDFFDEGFMYFNSLMRFLISFTAMVYFSPLFGSVAVVMGLLVIFVIFRFDKPFIEAHNEVNEREHVVSSTLFDSLSNIITVITLRLERRMESGLISKVMNILPPFRRRIRVNEWKWFTVDLMVASIYAVILLGYTYQSYTPGETFLIGGLVTLMVYVERFSSVFHNIAWQYNQIVRYNTDVQTARNIIEAYDENHLPDEMTHLQPGWRKLEIRNLNFSHSEAVAVPGKKRPHSLVNLAITVERGKRIALIGESGSGKSTLLALLRGLYPVEPGIEILVDGQPADDLGIISNHVTLFPQEPEIFENTIEYNITLGLPYVEKEIWKVCHTAHFEEVVRQLPKGLQSGIQEKGVNLSGGQKQRLALARGIFAARDSDIVLLDEPTSSVDPKTEMEIYDKLFHEFRDKAMVSSLHRLHLLTRFDYVYLLDQGEIVDEGTFEELLENSLPFRDLWKHQEEIAKATS